MQTKFVSTNSNSERNRSFGTYKCKKKKKKKNPSFLDFLDVDVLSVACESIVYIFMQ